MVIVIRYIIYCDFFNIYIYVTLQYTYTVYENFLKFARTHRIVFFVNTNDVSSNYQSPSFVSVRGL